MMLHATSRRLLHSRLTKTTQSLLGSIATIQHHNKHHNATTHTYTKHRILTQQFTRHLSSQSNTTNAKSSPSISDVVGEVKAASPATWVDGKLTTDNNTSTTTNTTTTDKDTKPASPFGPNNYNKALFDEHIIYETQPDGTQIPILKPLPAKLPLKQRVKNWYKDNTELIGNSLILGTILGYGTYYTLTELSQSLTQLFISLMPTANELEIAYLVGLCSSAIIFALYRISVRLTRTNTQSLYRTAVKHALNNTVVQQQLGAIKPIAEETLAVVNQIDTPNLHDKPDNNNETTATTDTTTSTDSTATTTDTTTSSILQHGTWHTAVMLPSGFRILPEHNKIQYYGWERYWRPQSLITNFILTGSQYNGIVSAHVTHKLNGSTDVRQMNLYIPETQQTYNIVDLPLQYKYTAKGAETSTNDKSRSEKPVT